MSIESCTKSIFQCVEQITTNTDPAAPAAQSNHGDGADGTVAYEAPLLHAGAADARTEVATDIALRGLAPSTGSRTLDVIHAPKGQKMPLFQDDQGRTHLVTTRQSSWEAAQLEAGKANAKFNAEIDAHGRAVAKSVSRDVGKLHKLPVHTQYEMQKEIDAYKTARGQADALAERRDAAAMRVDAAEKRIAAVEQKIYGSEARVQRDEAKAELAEIRATAEKRGEIVGKFGKALSLVSTHDAGEGLAEVAEVTLHQAIVGYAEGEADAVERRIDRLQQRMDGAEALAYKADLDAAKADLAAARKELGATEKEYVVEQHTATRALDRLAKLETTCGATMFHEIRAYRVAVGVAGYQAYKADRAYEHTLRTEALDDDGALESDARAARHVLHDKTQQRGWSDDDLAKLAEMNARQERLIEWAGDESYAAGTFADDILAGAHLAPLDPTIDVIYGALDGTRDEDVVL